MLLSRNHAPSADLAPYIRQYYVFEAHLPADFELIDKLMSETAFIRILLKGDWAAELDPGIWSSFGPVPLMGANGIPAQVRVRGPFHVVGIAIRPMGWRCLFDCPASDIADRAAGLIEDPFRLSPRPWPTIGARLQISYTSRSQPPIMMAPSSPPSRLWSARVLRRVPIVHPMRPWNFSR